MDQYITAVSAYEFLRIPALSLFSVAFFLEILLVVRMFGPTGAVQGWMKAWFITGFSLVSLTNVYAALEVSGNSYLGPAVITKMMYCGGIVHLSIIVYVFHIPIWKKREMESENQGDDNQELE